MDVEEHGVGNPEAFMERATWESPMPLFAEQIVAFFRRTLGNRPPVAAG